MLPRQHGMQNYDQPLQMDEVGFGDPLGEYCENSSFNIIQFLADSDTPVESPLEAQRSQLQRAQQQQQQQQQQIQPQDPHHGQNRQQQVAGGMFQTGTRLPDSPPITDISGPGSSASPSTNSDSPYSPENFINYGVIHGAHQNGNGLILGVNDLQNNLMMQPSDLLPQNLHGTIGFATDIKASPSGQDNQSMGRLLPQNSQNVPSFQMPYSTAPSTQVSPQNRCNPNQGYATPYSMDGYPPQASDAGSMHSEGPHSKKRRLPQGQATPVPQYAQPHLIQSPQLDFGDENFHQQVEVIKFNKFQEETWNPVYDINHTQLSQYQVHVVADKGFNYSPIDQCFVNQKKNHFQITVMIQASDDLPAHYMRTKGQMVPIKEFRMSFCGAKSEMVTSEIQIKQSQTDRKPIPHDPVILKIEERRMTRVTVPRLHFSETTLNNMRKNSKPNPDQKYFLLVVRLFAVTEDDQAVMVQAYASEKVIVRATNPGQFDQPDTEILWSKQGDTMVCPGKVVVGGDRQIGDAHLSVHGNMTVSGNVNRLCDERLKENIIPMNSSEVMDRYRNYQVYKFSYKPEVAKDWGLDEFNRNRAGMIAQQLQQLYPEAVVDNGDFLTVDENRLFYDNMVVTKELMQLTQDLDKKIVDNVDELQKRIKYLMRKKQVLGSIASGLSDATSGFGDAKSYISMSTTSLAEEGKGKKGRRNKKDCHNSTCQRSAPLCSNKLTQGTIVTLVIVMALCLLAMSALYILDWHNRNSAYVPMYPPVQPPNKDTKDEVGHMIAENFWIPKKQEGITPLMSHCSRDRCATFCCADEIRYKQHNKDNKDMDAFVPLQHTDSAHAFDKRSVPDEVAGNPLPSGVKIEILNMNTTITEKYCLSGSCNKKRGRYNLYIPISSYLPTIDIQLRFRTPIGRIVNSCGHLAEFHHKPCFAASGKTEKMKNPVVNQVTEDIYELSAGTFMQSAYRFRVGYTTESCYASEVHLVGTYDEYNIVFYRSCTAPAPNN